MGKVKLETSVMELPMFCIPKSAFTTKKEFASQLQPPKCPIVPQKRKSTSRSGSSENSLPRFGEAKLLVGEFLSPLYNRSVPDTYLNQVFYSKIKIGEGSFANVYKVISRENNNAYAVKHFKDQHSKQGKYTEIANILKVGYHPNITRYYLAWEENAQLFMQMDWCQMSLGEYTMKNHNVSHEQVQKILYDIAKALGYLHSKQLVHLDVKPDNILIDNGEYKLCDLGLVLDLNSDKESYRLASEGDSRYLAPEVLDGIYSEHADIFALGLSMIEVATDYILPLNGSTWHALRLSEAPITLPTFLPMQLISLLYRMMKREYKMRPTALEILDDPVLKHLSSSMTVIGAEGLTTPVDVVLPPPIPVNLRNTYEDFVLYKSKRSPIYENPSARRKLVFNQSNKI